MKHYTSIISAYLAEKLKEKGMPMMVWKGISQGLPFLSVMEKSSYNWLDDEMGILEPQMVERRYCIPSYAEVFDWLAERGLYIRIIPTWDAPSDTYLKYEFRITELKVPFRECFGWVSYTWHRAANTGIEKALEIIKED